ncbi:MAG: hypothetical protein K5872_04260 [Rhizobiaceae bacterium]|nr:hypothetical protein [Rhizobiaceae bacterium]MCV0405424.1 hypothetical protein [Rhizobiaceae bacterium]
MRAGIRMAVLLLATSAGAAAANSAEPRMLDDGEAIKVVEALSRASTQPLSDDPSCKADLSDPRPMSVADGLGVALLKAVTSEEATGLTLQCVDRAGYPKTESQEYCALNFATGGGAEMEYGLIFLMDWQTGAVVEGSVECY